jgi:hypothetical protein
MSSASHTRNLLLEASFPKLPKIAKSFAKLLEMLLCLKHYYHEGRNKHNIVNHMRKHTMAMELDNIYRTTEKSNK